MKYIVQKFGGTSVSTNENRHACLRHIQNALNENYRVVVVVSAMGRKGDPYATDTLLSLIDTQNLPKKEMDLLLSTGEIISANVFSSMLFEENIDNVILTGGQAGIITNDEFTNAQIISLQSERLQKELQQHPVVIVPGFQGVTPSGDITTLGRGGSDTSATALAAAINAEYVDIFTDVEGIMTADPRIVKEASMLSTVSYNEVCNLAYLGASVIHPRAVEIAMQKNIPIRVRSTFSEHPGTLVTNVSEMNRYKDVYDHLITGITQTKHITQLTITDQKHSSTFHADVFKAMEEEHISVDFINVYAGGVSYTVSNTNAPKAIALLKTLGFTVKTREDCAKVSLVGGGIAGVPGVMSKIVSTLTKEGIQILQSADSHTTIWLLVQGNDMEKSISALHYQFELHKK